MGPKSDELCSITSCFTLAVSVGHGVLFIFANISSKLSVVVLSPLLHFSFLLEDGEAVEFTYR